MTETIKNNITLVDPNAKDEFKHEEIEVAENKYLKHQWQTPGLYLAQKIASNPLVHYVGEEIHPDCIQIVVVVDDDPEELVDKIFSVEQEMYRKFTKLRFDMRLRVIPNEDNIEVIKSETIGHYDREEFKYISK